MERRRLVTKFEFSVLLVWVFIAVFASIFTVHLIKAKITYEDLGDIYRYFTLSSFAGLMGTFLLLATGIGMTAYVMFSRIIETEPKIILSLCMLGIYLMGCGAAHEILALLSGKEGFIL